MIWILFKFKFHGTIFDNLTSVLRVDSHTAKFSLLNYFIVPLHITFTIFLLFTIFISLPTSISSLYSFEALVIYVGWMTFHVVMERILPGSWFSSIQNINEINCNSLGSNLDNSMCASQSIYLTHQIANIP